MRFHSNSSLAVGALLLAGIWMIAPAASGALGRKAQSSQPANIAVAHAGGNGVRRADTGKSGDNPLYEGKGQADVKPGSGASAVQYKDPEDMTTRYRPGNNKTTLNSIAVDHAGGNGVRRADGGQNTGTSSNPSPSAETQNRKHPGNVKYGNFHLRGGNAPGMAVNEQGSRGPAQIYKRH